MMANDIGIPATLESQPMTIIDSARIDPTERSIPPMTITAVMPSAMIPSTVS